MRIRFKVRLKILICLLLAVLFLLFYADTRKYKRSDDSDIVSAKRRRVASITAEDLPEEKSDNFQPDIPDRLKTDPQNVKCLAKEGKKCNTGHKTTKVNSKRTRGYASRVLVENVTLPTEWTVSANLSRKLKQRREHVREVCHKYGLDKRNAKNQPNAWEFLINENYGLVWCSVFKAASSTWFYNFNILAGYGETALLNAKETPIQIARKKYERPSVAELDQVLNSTDRPLTFMIARHPLERLVSAFRDKIQSGSKFYRSLGNKIKSAYPNLGDKKDAAQVVTEQSIKFKSLSHIRKFLVKYVPPNFIQFVQYIIDSVDKGLNLDEHWAPMTTFCTPCLVDFDVYAKVESMDEDANYIIFSSGIEKVIKPKRINIAKNGPTNEVAKSFLCQLSKDQITGLLKLYKFDMELFDYKSDHLLNCPRSNQVTTEP